MKRRTQEERREVLNGLLRGKYMILDTEEKITIGAGLILSGGAIPKEDIPDIAVILGDLTKTVGSHALFPQTWVFRYTGS